MEFAAFERVNAVLMMIASGTDRGVATAMIGMVMRVDDPAHGRLGNFADLSQQLAALLRVQSCIDDENSLIADEER